MFSRICPSKVRLQKIYAVIFLYILTQFRVHMIYTKMALVETNERDKY